VSNAGPLIHLAKISVLALLHELYGEVISPAEVKSEVIDRGQEKGYADAIKIQEAIEAGWMKVEEVTVGRKFATAAKVAGLRDAELAVAYHAYKNRTMALLDDEGARVFARTLGISIRGSVGILLEAVKKGLIRKDDGLRKLDELAEVMYLTNTVYRLARKRIEK
jgi:predicted nucleic acid-binding protein